MTQIDEVNLCIVNAFVEIRKIIRDDYRMVIYDSEVYSLQAYFFDGYIRKNIHISLNEDNKHLDIKEHISCDGLHKTRFELTSMTGTGPFSIEEVKTIITNSYYKELAMPRICINDSFVKSKVYEEMTIVYYNDESSCISKKKVKTEDLLLNNESDFITINDDNICFKNIYAISFVDIPYMGIDKIVENIGHNIEDDRESFIAYYKLAISFFMEFGVLTKEYLREFASDIYMLNLRTLVNNMNHATINIYLGYHVRFAVSAKECGNYSYGYQGKQEAFKLDDIIDKIYNYVNVKLNLYDNPYLSLLFCKDGLYFMYDKIMHEEKDGVLYFILDDRTGYVNKMYIYSDNNNIYNVYTGERIYVEPDDTTISYCAEIVKNNLTVIK